MDPGKERLIPKVLERQLDLLSNMPVEGIPRGASVPFEYIIRSLPSEGYGTVVSVGCGAGEKPVELAKMLQNTGYSVMGLDVNGSAIEVANELGAGLDNLFFHVVDVTNPGQMKENVELGTVSVAVAEGFFCNQTGINALKAAEGINTALARNGVLWVADCLTPFHQRVFRQALQDMGRGGGQLNEWRELCRYVYTMVAGRKLWKYVYEQNSKIFGPLDPYTFAVFDPGERDRWKQGTEQILDRLMAGDFERFARHWDLSLFSALCEVCGFKMVDYGLRVWWGRAHEPLLGFVAKFQKMFDVEARDLLGTEYQLLQALTSGYQAGKGGF